MEYVSRRIFQRFRPPGICSEVEVSDSFARPCSVGVAAFGILLFELFASTPFERQRQSMPLTSILNGIANLEVRRGFSSPLRIRVRVFCVRVYVRVVRMRARAHFGGASHACLISLCLR